MTKGYMGSTKEGGFDDADDRHAATVAKCRLTALEKRMLVSAADLILAGEWPWEPEVANERTALERAAKKLKGQK